MTKFIAYIRKDLFRKERHLFLSYSFVFFCSSLSTWFHRSLLKMTIVVPHIYNKTLNRVALNFVAIFCLLWWCLSSYYKRDKIHCRCTPQDLFRMERAPVFIVFFCFFFRTGFFSHFFVFPTGVCVHIKNMTTVIADTRLKPCFKSIGTYFHLILLFLLLGSHWDCETHSSPPAHRLLLSPCSWSHLWTTCLRR